MVIMIPGFMMLCGESLFHGALQGQFLPGFVALVFVSAQPAQAMLGADGALTFDDQVMHQEVDCRLAGREGSRIVSLGSQHIEMQVAISHVAKPGYAHAGHQGCQRGLGLGDEAGDCRNWQGNVVLDVHAFQALGLRDAFAQRPQGARLRQGLGYDTIGHPASFESVFQKMLQRLAGVRFAVVVRQFNQHGYWIRLIKGPAQTREMLG